MDKLAVYETTLRCLKDACIELSEIVKFNINPFRVGIEGLTYIEIDPYAKKVNYYTQVDFEENVAINPRALYVAILSTILESAELGNKTTVTLFRVKFLVSGKAEPDGIMYTVGREIL